MVVTEKFQENLMSRVLELAARGWPDVSPNPLVGAVIVKDGKIISEGWHRQFGGPHAEIEALRAEQDSSKLKGSELFVNLEPCCHFGKTPPCVNAIIQAGISRVFISALDPNPLVSGGGVSELRNAGIEVNVGLLEKESLRLNKRFYTGQILNRPFVILKWAQTSDGLIARSDGSSKWISSQESRTLVHKWRSEETAVVVGSRTAIVDNPELTVRNLKGRNPVRVLIDPMLRVSKESKLYNSDAPTIVFNTLISSESGNISFVQLAGPVFDLSLVLEILYKRGIQSCLVEGGANLINRLIESGLWDEARVFTSLENFSQGISAPLFLTPLSPTMKAVTEENISSDRLCIFEQQRFSEEYEALFRKCQRSCILSL